MGAFSMYIKIIFMTVTILISGQVFAQNTPAAKKTATSNTTPSPEPKKESISIPAEAKPAEPALTTAQKIVKYMKEKFSASYHGEYYITRRLPFYEPITDNEQKKIQDLLIMHNPTLIYKPSTNWQALATAEFKYSDKPNYVVYPNTFFRSLFTITRKNILTEESNGVKLDAGIGRRQFNTGLAVASYGNNRIFTTLTKGKGSLFLQYLQNDYRKSSATTWKHGFEVIPTYSFQLSEKLTWLFNDDIVINTSKFDNNQRDYYITHDMNIGYFTYQWTDKFSTYYQLKYVHLRYDFTKDYRSDLESIDYYIGASYSFTPKLTLAGEFGSQLFRAGDGKNLFAENVKYPEFAFYLDFSL